MRQQKVCPHCNRSYWELRPSEKKILSALGLKELGFTELANATNLSSPSLSQALTFLTTHKFVKRGAGRLGKYDVEK